MNPAQLRDEQRRMNIAMRDGRFDEAQKIAVRIAPHIDALYDAADRDGKNPAHIEKWGCDA